MNIRFGSKEALERFAECSTGEHAASLATCMMSLLRWRPHDATAVIGNDFDERSFFFREVMPDGSSGMCGGIICHGARDGYGSGEGPTFSVSLGRADGYSIHT